MARFFALLTLYLMLGFFLPTAAADNLVTQNDLAAHKELITLKIDGKNELAQKDIDAIKIRIDALDKRVDDQNSRTDTIATNISIFSVVAALMSVLITVLLVAFGVFSYRSATRDARDTAINTVEDWIARNLDKIHKQLNDFESEVESARANARDLNEEVDNDRCEYIKRRQDNITLGSRGLSGLTENEEKASASKTNQVDDKSCLSVKHAEAIAAFKEGRFSSAAEIWREIVEHDKFDNRLSPKALFHLALCLFNQQKFDEACDNFKKYVQKYCNSDDTVIFRMFVRSMGLIGDCLYSMGKKNEARDQYLKVYVDYGAQDIEAVNDVVFKAMISLAEIEYLLGNTYRAMTINDDIYRMGKSHKKIKNYERDVICSALNFNAHISLHEAKKTWVNKKVEAMYNLQKAKDYLESIIDPSQSSEYACILSNGSYVAWLDGRGVESENQFEKALDQPRSGGQVLYEITLQDIASNTIKEDDGFKGMVERQWALYQEKQRRQPNQPDGSNPSSTA